MPVQTIIQLRTSAAATWTSVNPTLALGEQGYESDTGKSKIGDGSTAWASLPYQNTGGSVAQSQITGLVDDLAAKAPLNAPSFTGLVTTNGLSVTGDLTVGGTTTTVNTQDLVVTDPLIYIAEGNTANVVDVGIVGSFDDGTYQHTGLARDATDGKWKLFKGVIDEPTTTINFAQGSLATLAVGTLEASSADFTGSVDFTGATVTGIETLPDQSGNTGKYLTTDGSTPSWATVDVSGKVSQTNGTVTTADTSLGVVRNTYISTSVPSGGMDGDVWFRYI